MSMGMSMSLSQSFSLRQEQRLSLNLPHVNWSLLKAFKQGGLFPPRFKEPDYNAQIFTPRLKLHGMRIQEDFDYLPHEVRMWLVDEANEVFRFTYSEGEEREWSDDVGDWEVVKRYYRIPLVRNCHVDPEDIAEEITQEEHERCSAILEAVGEIERIARAIPYYRLYQDVKAYLDKEYQVSLNEVSLVTVDRGGRLPGIILMQALGLRNMESIKVDQGWGDSGKLDEERLQEFAARQVLKDKHILFVDSTVDSGRQINILKRYLGNADWQARLGFRSWSVVGSNENGDSLKHHHNLNWGVDPDETFEDDPDLMGIDYAPGSRIKIVEQPTQTSAAIRKCLLSVPAGHLYWADDIKQQIEEQRQYWAVHPTRKRKSVQQLISRLIQLDCWKQLKVDTRSLPQESFPAIVPSYAPLKRLNVLLVGGKKLDLPPTTADFITSSLAPHCNLMAGTIRGNPGSILCLALRRDPRSGSAVRLYCPETARHGHWELPGEHLIFAGRQKNEMRQRMVTDADVILALGGADGTLREVLLALKMGKPTIVIRDYGPVAHFILSKEVLRNLPNLIACNGAIQAVQSIRAIAQS